jgi:DNA modification methylase
MANQIYNEDCIQTNERALNYHYVITSPPDMDELGESDMRDTDIVTYKEFLKSTFTGLNPINECITMFVSDRKANGRVYQKHYWVTEIMQELGWRLYTQKIWVKDYDNAYIYKQNYTFILTFKREGGKKILDIGDVFYEQFKPASKNYIWNFSKEIAKKFIEVHTEKGEIVYDPFIGSGTTAVASIELAREYYGAEIDKDTFQLAENRISQINTLNKFL